MEQVESEVLIRLQSEMSSPKILEDRRGPKRQAVMVKQSFTYRHITMETLPEG